jgi:N-acetylglucosaminyldiphosphoundecaprenol N-acetyl-beta-D-mannosaminyltransferase
MNVQEACSSAPRDSFASPMEASPTVALLGVKLNHLREEQCVDVVMRSLGKRRGGWIVTHNLDHMRRLARDGEFAAMCMPAELRVADGMPLVWAAKLQGTPLPERVAGSSLILSLSQAAGAAGRSIFLLGGTPGTAELAGKELAVRFPGLQIAGVACPTLGFETDEAQLHALREQLAASGADIVYVALGSPKQERLISQFRDALPSAWWVGVGISFSFITGEVRRAPRWIQNCGLEWTHRLVQEPRRLARRYLLENLPFAAILFTDAGRQRLLRSANRNRSALIS